MLLIRLLTFILKGATTYHKGSQGGPHGASHGASHGDSHGASHGASHDASHMAVDEYVQ